MADVEYTLTDTVSEALLLEATLIKRHQPRFNVRLKDDKSYPYIKVTLGDDFPRIERTRKLPKDGSRYFGPYASASQRRRGHEPHPAAVPVPDLHHRHQRGRTGAARPCLLYHIKRCQGPCIEAITKDDYRADIDQVMLFLEGRKEQVARRSEDMLAASDRLEYERAAALRDKVRAIERTMESQKMAAFARDRAGRPRLRAIGRRGGGPAVRHPRRQDRRPRRLPAREPRRRARRGGPHRRSSSSTTPPPARCRRACCCR